MSTSTTTSIRKLSTVCVPIADQERALDFYVGKLGFEKRVDVPMGDDMRWIEVAPAGSEATVALAPPPPNSDIQVGNRETGISFETSDIDALHADLRDRGADVDEAVSRMGDPVPPIFWLRDPEGNSLMVVEAP